MDGGDDGDKDKDGVEDDARDGGGDGGVIGLRDCRTMTPLTFDEREAPRAIDIATTTKQKTKQVEVLPFFASTMEVEPLVAQAEFT